MPDTASIAQKLSPDEIADGSPNEISAMRVRFDQYTVRYENSLRHNMTT